MCAPPGLETVPKQFIHELAGLVPILHPHAPVSIARNRVQERTILDACPHDCGACSFYGWMNAGHVGREGKMRITIVVLVLSDGGSKIVSIRAAEMFDTSEPVNQELLTAVAGELAGRPGARVGWGKFPDDAEVIYVYDRDDDNFGHAFNLTAPDCSEWGYAPFPPEIPT